jgi:hypothetical protein
MKTHAPVRTSSKPAGPARTEKDGTAPSRRVVQAAPRSDVPQAGLHDFSRMELPFRSSAADGVVHGAARVGLSTPAGSLPHLERIQHSFGRHNIRATPAHVTPDAAESAEAIGAKGYTAYGHVVLGRGSDLRTVAHEAAHVVQQQQRIQLSGGTGRVGDPYERHADAVAERVVAGRSAEGLLDRVAPGHCSPPTARVSPFAPASSTGSHAVQAKIYAKPLPGQISGYFSDGRVPEFNEGTILKTLALKLRVRQHTDYLVKDAGNNPFEQVVAGKLKTEELKVTDVEDARDLSKPAQVSRGTNNPKIQRGHKQSSKEIQDTIKKWATAVIQGSNSSAAANKVDKLVESIEPVDWVKAESIDQDAIKDDYKAYLGHVKENYSNAQNELANAKDILADIRDSKPNDQNDHIALDSGIGSLNALAATIAGSPINFFFNHSTLNSSAGGGSDRNAAAAPPSQQPPLLRPPTPETRHIAKVRGGYVVATEDTENTDIRKALYSEAKLQLDEDNKTRVDKHVLVRSSAVPAGYISIPESEVGSGSTGSEVKISDADDDESMKTIDSSLRAGAEHNRRKEAKEAAAAHAELIHRMSNSGGVPDNIPLSNSNGSRRNSVSGNEDSKNVEDFDVDSFFQWNSAPQNQNPAGFNHSRSINNTFNVNSSGNNNPNPQDKSPLSTDLINIDSPKSNSNKGPKSHENLYNSAWFPEPTTPLSNSSGYGLLQLNNNNSRNDTNNNASNPLIQWNNSNTSQTPSLIKRKSATAKEEEIKKNKAQKQDQNKSR